MINNSKAVMTYIGVLREKQSVHDEFYSFGSWAKKRSSGEEKNC